MDAKVAKPEKRTRRAPRERLPDTPDPVDIAMVAVASGKPISDVARRVLEEQAELIHAQRTELRLKHIGNVVRAALWTLLAVVAFGLVLVLGTAAYRAARADTLVVESFRVPPAMAAQGLAGEVIATQVLDKVAEFQSKTESVRAASSYENNWGDDLKIDIPNTGATAEQVWNLLRSWLGKETRISGEVIQAGPRVTLTARIGSAAGRRFTSDNGNLDELVTRAAEHILRETQPYRYAVYAERVAGNREDQLAVLQQLTRHESAAERKWAFNGLAIVAAGQGNPRARRAWAARALAIDPNMFPAWLNTAFASIDLGHEQRGADILRRTFEFEPTEEYDPDIIAMNNCLNRGSVGLLTSDPAEVSASADCSAASGGTGADWASYYGVSAALLRHDVQAALTYSQPATTSISPADTANFTADIRLRGEMERGGSPALAAALETYRETARQVLSSPGGAYRRAILATYDAPLEARALILLGRVDEAAALIATTPRDCYTCVRVRGLVAEARGNWPEAQRWFAEAVRQGPRLAAAYVDWGKLLIRAGRYDSASRKLSRAAELSLNWADPYKYWGDALAARGERAEALAKYETALKLAPKWAQLRQARARLAPGS